jgi:phospholipase/lecithinase/hemolysin
VNLPDQVEMYLAAVPHTSSSTLVAIEIGGNDVRDALVAGLQNQDPAPYITNAIGSLYQNVMALYQGGARRFLILNVPDVGKTPAIRLLDQLYPGVASFAGLLSTGYNGALTDLVSALNTLPGMDARILDVHEILDDAIASPAAYGFVNVTDACITPGEPPFTCRKPDTYAFWDGIHPTRALHALVAEQALTVLSIPDAKGRH